MQVRNQLGAFLFEEWNPAVTNPVSAVLKGSIGGIFHSLQRSTLQEIGEFCFPALQQGARDSQSRITQWGQGVNPCQSSQSGTPEKVAQQSFSLIFDVMGEENVAAIASMGDFFEVKSAAISGDRFHGRFAVSPLQIQIFMDDVKRD